MPRDTPYKRHVDGVRNPGSGVSHDTAMKLRYNKATLHRLPAPGVQWRWSDVVDKNDGSKVDPTDAHAAKPLLEKVDDGVWMTTAKLAAYLDSKWDVTVGENGGAGQAHLPVETAVTTESRVLTDGSGSPPDSTGEPRQKALDGSDATADVRPVGVQEDPRVLGEYSANPMSKHEIAVKDAGQVRLGAFQQRVTIGRLTRPTGNVYA